MTRQRHRQHGNPFSVRCDAPIIDWAAVYGRQAPLALDVGFGRGSFTLELARLHPEWNVLGLEIRQHLVDSLNERAARAGLTNLHAVLANVNQHLSETVPERSLLFVAINFPDPWFKKRHQKRRVVRPEWIHDLLPKLLPGAELHVMTDYEPVALEVQSVLGAEPALVSATGASFASTSTTGITSEREVSHLRRGAPVFRLHYRFAAGAPA